MRILLIEDDPELADGLKHYLRLSGHVVDIFTRGGEGLAAATDTAYDVAILDLGLPDMDGIAVLRALRARSDRTPILVLTARDELDDRIRGLDAGADDYMVKPFAVGELEARLRALARRPRTAAPTVLRLGRLSLDVASQTARIDDEPTDLPARELAVLRKLMERPGAIVSKEALFDALYGWEDEARPQAVEVYVSRLRKRLEPGRIGIRALRGLGYRLEIADA